MLLIVRSNLCNAFARLLDRRFQTLYILCLRAQVLLGLDTTARAIERHQAPGKTFLRELIPALLLLPKNRQRLLELAFHLERAFQIMIGFRQRGALGIHRIQISLPARHVLRIHLRQHGGVISRFTHQWRALQFGINAPQLQSLELVIHLKHTTIGTRETRIHTH